MGRQSIEVLISAMIKNKLWKLEINDKLNSKLDRPANPPTPIDLYTPTMITDSQKQQLEGFQLSPFTAFVKKEDNMHRERQAEKKTAARQSIKVQSSERISRERQEYRQSLGGASKTMQRMHDELITAEKELEERQLELIRLNSELVMMEESQRIRKKHTDDIVNNENMLKFKEEQLSNLMAINAEIIEGARKQIIKEQHLREQIHEKYANKKSILDQYRVQLAQKQNMVRHIDDLTREKGKLEKVLHELKQAEAKKLAMRSGAIREVVERIIKVEKYQLQNECTATIKEIRDSSVVAKNSKQLKAFLQSKGINPSSFYSYNQLKYVKQFDFKTYPQNQKLFELFDLEIKPKLFDIVEEGAQPPQLTTLKAELARMEDFKEMTDSELRQKEIQIEKLQQQRKSLLEGIENKKKAPGK